MTSRGLPAGQPQPQPHAGGGLHQVRRAGRQRRGVGVPEVLAVVREQVGQGQVVGHRSRLWPTARSAAGTDPVPAVSVAIGYRARARCARIGGEGAPRRTRPDPAAGLSIRPRTVRRTGVSTRTAVREPEGERHGSVRRPDLRRRERLGQQPRDVGPGDEGARPVRRAGGRARRHDPRRRGAAAHRHRHHDPRRRRHRRPVRGDQGGPRRVLPDRGPGPGPRDRARPGCARPASAASRSARAGHVGRGRPARDVRPTRSARSSPRCTVASGPACSPRRCASPATWTWPRSASRTRSWPRCRPGRATACRAARGRG